MRRISRYSLIELLAVMAVMVVLGGVLFGAYHRYNRDFLASSREVVSGEIFRVRDQFCRAAEGFRPPLALEGETIVSGKEIMAIPAGNRLGLLLDGRLQYFAVPGRMKAVLSVEDGGRTAVLNLTENKRTYRIVAAAGGASHEK